MSAPYHCIRDFFSALSLPRYRKYISSFLKAANRSDYWKKEEPGDLLYFQKKLQDLIGAAHILAKQRKGSTFPALSPEIINQETLNPSLYLAKSSGLSPWEAFPRHLSKKEFLDPYLAFERFFRRKSPEQWYHEMGEIFFYALSSYSCEDELLGLDLYQTARDLHKLTEAAHLIWVRELDCEPPAQL